MCWGWLESGSRAVPNVVLRGDGVAIGRGSDCVADPHSLPALFSGAPVDGGLDTSLPALTSWSMKQCVGC